MKRILVWVMICVFMISMTVVSFAEETYPESEAVESIEDIEKESYGESESPENVEEEPEKARTETWSGAIAGFFKENFTETSLTAFAIALLTFCLEHFSSNKNLKSHIGILNGNAIEIAETSAKNAAANAEVLEALKGEVTKWMETMENKISITLNVVTKTAEERAALESALAQNRELMNKVIIAAAENSDEIANLLLMSNIPMSKKEEMYARHYERPHLHRRLHR